MTPPGIKVLRRAFRSRKGLFLTAVAGLHHCFRALWYGAVAGANCAVPHFVVALLAQRSCKRSLNSFLLTINLAGAGSGTRRWRCGSQSVMAGPILGPVLGGWLTENYSWRYVFYINVPIGILCFLGMRAFLIDTARNAHEKLDWFGFGTLSLGIGAMQVLIDRGEELDWFGSNEIVVEALVAASALYLFLVHTFTAKEPFVKLTLFRDRNFAAGTVFAFVLGLTYYASLALQPPYLQSLMNYPIVTAGLVLGPRGVGTMAAMLVVSAV